MKLAKLEIELLNDQDGDRDGPDPINKQLPQASLEMGNLKEKATRLSTTQKLGMYFGHKPPTK